MLKTVIAHIQFTGRHLESHTCISRTLATPTEGDERYHVLFIGYLVIAALGLSPTPHSDGQKGPAARDVQAGRWVRGTSLYGVPVFIEVSGYLAPHGVIPRISIPQDMIIRKLRIIISCNAMLAHYIGKTFFPSK